eukprot:403341728
MAPSQCYVWGVNNDQRFGFETNQQLYDQYESDFVQTPQKCCYNIAIQQVACGLRHTHLLSQDGFLYSMGSNHDGILGLGQSYKDLVQQQSPRLVENIQNVKSISTGGNHSLAVTSDYKVYGWGQAEHGAIGLRLTNTSTPVEIQFDINSKNSSNFPIRQASCGLKHSIFLTVSGEVFSCGNGERGQLSIGYTSLKEYQPLKVQFDYGINDSVKFISCSSFNSIILTEKDRVYISGENCFGQLGNSKYQKEYENRPVEIFGLRDQQIKQVLISEKFGLALQYKGDIFIWGTYQDQLIHNPTKIQMEQLPPFKDVQISNSIISAIDIDQNLWVWNSIRNQNSLHISHIPEKILDLEDQLFEKIYLGNEIIFVISSQDQEQILLQDKQMELDKISQIKDPLTNKFDQSPSNFPQLELLKKKIKSKPKQNELQPSSFTLKKKHRNQGQSNQPTTRGHSQQPTNRSLLTNKVTYKDVTPKRKTSSKVQEQITQHLNSTFLSDTQNQGLQTRKTPDTLIPYTNSFQSQNKSFHYNYQTQQSDLPEQYSVIKMRKLKEESFDNKQIMPQFQVYTDQNISTHEDDQDNEDQLLRELNISQNMIQSNIDSMINLRPSNYSPLSSKIQNNNEHQNYQSQMIQQNYSSQNYNIPYNNRNSQPILQNHLNFNQSTFQQKCLINQSEATPTDSQENIKTSTDIYSLLIKNDLELKHRQQYEMSILKQENLKLKEQLNVEKLEKDKISREYQILVEQTSQDKQSLKCLIGLEEDYEQLHLKNDQLANINQQLQDRNLKLNEQLIQMKAQLIKISEQLSEREEDFQNFMNLGQKLEENELYVENLLKEKEKREDELINKMSTLADLYHKEKDKNQKTINELVRQNEMLQNFEQMLKHTQIERDFANSEYEKIREDMARIKVDSFVKKDQYKSFVRDISNMSPNLQNERDDIADKKQQFNKSSVKDQLKQRLSNQNINQEQEERENDEFNQTQNKRSESLTRLLRQHSRHERLSIDEKKPSQTLYRSFNHNMQSNNTTSQFNIQKITQGKDIQDNYERGRETLKSKIDIKERENYNNYVLKSVERQAQKASQERKSMNQSQNRSSIQNLNLSRMLSSCCENRDDLSQLTDCKNNMDYQGFLRDHSPMESHREIVSVLHDTHSTIRLQEVKNDQNSILSMKQLNDLDKSPINQAKSQDENKTQTQMSASNTKKSYLKQLVDQELSEISNLINNTHKTYTNQSSTYTSNHTTQNYSIPKKQPQSSFKYNLKENNNAAASQSYFNTNSSVKQSQSSSKHQSAVKPNKFEKENVSSPQFQTDIELKKQVIREEESHNFIKQNLMKRFSSNSTVDNC